VEFQKELAVAYTQLVVLSTDPPEVSAAFRAGLGAQFPFLCDQERKVQRLLDLQETTDPRHNPIIPYSFTLYPDLTIYRIYNGYWFWGRPTREELRMDFRAISREIRPDWDLQHPRTS
jgi:peroxiredoxin